MHKRDYIISKLCGIILIAIGVVDSPTPSVSLLAIRSIKHIFFQGTPPDTKYAALLLMVPSFLIYFLFLFLFVMSGIGVLRFKEWARKLALVTLVLYISIFLFFLIQFAAQAAPTGIYVVIGMICISISIIYFLSKKSIKKEFNGEKKRKLRRRGKVLD
jgi:polyferredoxin